MFPGSSEIIPIPVGALKEYEHLTADRDASGLYAGTVGFDSVPGETSAAHILPRQGRPDAFDCDLGKETLLLGEIRYTYASTVSFAQLVVIDVTWCQTLTIKYPERRKGRYGLLAELAEEAGIGCWSVAFIAFAVV
ncbi:uncharacterized protein MYCFIDRAFT_178132 [Pseudocercospora fijiensis CIRAD86]|uniref:Uncharacterized protein n=1 Tax=Pseudocercospora fijiensis (strain CIRAD86) TaxID=383855 RepID=M2ZKC4_PSEFD|nr:uncharacterized protein MYCFIDRAFT_178132 [Pseudocercospora fijiensis CIRAD86]EME79544.1 hypothetical protein MYCFIDRAFT_178132 [Pseudocercospora fijiensis CIRAD86]